MRREGARPWPSPSRGALLPDDLDRYRRVDLRVQVDADLVRAEAPDRLGQTHVVPVDVLAGKLLELLRHVRRRDGAEQLSLLTRTGPKADRFRCQRRRDALGFGARPAKP